MAYKRQSKKRKTPFKAYGKAHQVGIKFDKLKESKGNPNLTGQAVGAVGSLIGDAVDDYKDRKEGEDNPEGSTTPTQAENVAKLETLTPQGLDFKTDITGGDFGKTDTTNLGKGTPLNPRSNTQATPEGAEIKGYDKVEADEYQRILNETGDEAAAQAASKQKGADARQYNKDKFGTLNPTSEGKQQNYIASQDDAGGYVPGSTVKFDKFSTAEESAEGTSRITPLGRMSPLHRRNADFDKMVALRRSPLFQTKGRKLGELAQSSLTNVSYLGDVGRAGAEGYNSAIDRANYKQAVREEQAAELDEEFGNLEVPPSGYGNYDASVEQLARGWKTQFVDAKKAWKAGNLSNEDWITQKHQFQQNAKDYAAGAENLKASMANWTENRDNISDSTKPEIIDFYTTMEKYPDQLTVQDVDGIPTFMGETIGGKNISIPVAQLGKGSGAMRFNTKIDMTQELAPLAKELQGLKTEIATDNGIGIGNVDFDNPALQTKIDFSLDQIVNNNSKLREIAANYGMEYDEFEEHLETEGIDALKSQIKDKLKADVQRSYFPVEKTTRTNQQLQNDQLTGQYKENQIAQQNAAADPATQGIGASTQTEREQARLTTHFDTLYNSEEYKNAFANGAIDAATFNKMTGLTGEIDESDGFLYAFSGNKIIRVDPKDPVDVMKGMGRASGLAEGRLNPTPFERKKSKSPFRRAYNWMSEQFK